MHTQLHGNRSTHSHTHNGCDNQTPFNTHSHTMIHVTVHLQHSHPHTSLILFLDSYHAMIHTQIHIEKGSMVGNCQLTLLASLHNRFRFPSPWSHMVLIPASCQPYHQCTIHSITRPEGIISHGCTKKDQHLEDSTLPLQGAHMKCGGSCQHS